jgi:hypothetical protein
LLRGEVGNPLEIGIMSTVCLCISTLEIRDEPLISRLVYLAILVLAEIGELKRSRNTIEDFLAIFGFHERP